MLRKKSRKQMTDGKLRKYLDKTNSRRKAISNIGALGVVVILVVGLFGFAYFYIGPPSPGSTLKSSSSSTIAAGNVAGKIQFTILNPTSGAALTPTTFTIYPGAGVTVGGVTYTGQTPSESPTPASGVATTAQFYPPGAQLTIKMALSGSITENWVVIAPGVTQGQQAQGTAAALTLPMMQAPTIVVSLTDGAGNTYASAGNKINFTKSGTCTGGDNCLGTSTTKLDLHHHEHRLQHRLPLDQRPAEQRPMVPRRSHLRGHFRQPQLGHLLWHADDLLCRLGAVPRDHTA